MDNRLTISNIQSNIYTCLLLQIIDTTLNQCDLSYEYALIKTTAVLQIPEDQSVCIQNFSEKDKIMLSGCTNSNQLWSSQKKKKKKSIIVFSFVFFSHSFLSFNKNNDKARIFFPAHFVGNVELVKQKVQSTTLTTILKNLTVLVAVCDSNDR